MSNRLDFMIKIQYIFVIENRFTKNIEFQKMLNVEILIFDIFIEISIYRKYFDKFDETFCKKINKKINKKNN